MKYGIKAKTIVPIAAILLLAMTVLALFNYISQVNILNSEAEDSLQGAVNSAQSIINERLKQYQQMAVLVAGMPTATQAFAKGDRARLLAEFEHGFDILKKEYGVAQFQYHLPVATSFLRVHQPEKFGDDLVQIRKTVVYTNENKKGARGIEVGRGGLGLRGVVPVTHQGKHLGSVEFGGELAPAIDEAKKVFNVEVGVLLSLTAESKAWPEWHKKTERIGENILFYGTNDALITQIVKPAMLANAQPSAGNVYVTTATAGGRDYHVALAPLKDYSGTVIGYLAIMKDRTALVGKIRTVLLINIVIYLILLAGIAWAVQRSLTNTVISPVLSLTKAADDISMGKFSEKIEIRSKDEIETLAKSIDRMRVSMKKLLE